MTLTLTETGWNLKLRIPKSVWILRQLWTRQPDDWVIWVRPPCRLLSVTLLQHCIFCSFIASAKMTLSWCKQISQPQPEAPDPPPGKTSWWEAVEPGGRKWGTCCSQRSSERAAFKCSTFCTRNHPSLSPSAVPWIKYFHQAYAGYVQTAPSCGDTGTAQSALISTSNTISCNICLWLLSFLPEYLRTI